MRRTASTRWAAAALLAALTASGAGPVAAERQAGVSGYEAFRLGLVHVGFSTVSGDLVAIQWLGSGFLVDDECTVVTARHILEDVEIGRVILRFLHPDPAQGVRTFSARLLWEDPDRDVAFLAFAGGTYGKKFCRSNTLTPLPLAETATGASLTGKSVLVAGFPLLEGEQPRDVPILKRGIIASSELTWDERPMLLLDLTGVPGLSGGPVMLEEGGAAIGLIFGPGRTSRQYDLEWATPITRGDYEKARRAWTGAAQR